MLFCRLLILFKINFFEKKTLAGISSGCQIVGIKIRPNILSGLIWVQTVSKSYQQTTLGDELISKDRQLNMSLLVKETISH